MAVENAITKRDNGAWEVDMQTFLPDPNGYIKVAGEEYPIFSFLDIPVEESVRILKMADQINATDDLGERMALSIKHLLILNDGPDEGRGDRKRLTEDMLKKLTPRAIVTLVTMANSVAAVPLKADPEMQTESVSSVPESAGSTDGATAK
jgi:hypothetical protein